MDMEILQGIEMMGHCCFHVLSRKVRLEMSQGESPDSAQFENDPWIRLFSANGDLMQTTVVEAKLDEVNIQEAESALRDGLSLNFEEASTLLGKLEYQRGNIEGALRVFDGIDLQAAIKRMQDSLGATNLVLEAIYLKPSLFRRWEILLEVANLYSSLSHWKDAEICLGKARVLKEYSAETLHIEGMMHEKQGHTNEALAAYSNAILLGPTYMPCKISIGALLYKMGSKMLPVSRTFLSDALRIEPANYLAWYYLGKVHKDGGRIADAVECFQAASVLEDSDPVESFSSIL